VLVTGIETEENLPSPARPILMSPDDVGVNHMEKGGTSSFDRA